jgi:hypothetical protein
MNSDISSISLKMTMATYGGSICDCEKIGIITIAHEKRFPMPARSSHSRKLQTFPEYLIFKITVERIDRGAKDHYIENTFMR